MARYIAKNLVAANVAGRCEVQLAYAIGVADPVSVCIETFGTHNIDPGILENLVRSHFDLKPAGIVKTLDLLKPRYLSSAAYGHFGRKRTLIYLGENRQSQSHKKRRRFIIRENDRLLLSGMSCIS